MVKPGKLAVTRRGGARPPRHIQLSATLHWKKLEASPPPGGAKKRTANHVWRHWSHSLYFFSMCYSLPFGVWPICSLSHLLFSAICYFLQFDISCNLLFSAIWYLVPIDGCPICCLFYLLISAICCLCNLLFSANCCLLYLLFSEFWYFLQFDI